MNLLDTRSPAAAGFSLLELVVATVLLVMMVFAVSTLTVRGGDAQEYAGRLNRVTEITQELLEEMRLELVSSVRMFGNDVEGAENLAAFDLAGAPAPLADVRLPTIAPAESIRADTAGNEITGNRLFFAKVAWSDRYTCMSGNQYLVDVYRWVQYYLTPEDGGPDPTRPIGLNIVRVVSEPIIDADTIDRISDPDDQAELLLHLHDATPDSSGVTHPPAELVWRRGGLPSVLGTFQQVRDADGSLSDTPTDGRASPWQVLRAAQSIEGLLSYRHHSIATIYAQDSYGVGRFGIESTVGGGFPHGFEVQVVGPSSARQVLLHLTAVSTRRKGFWAWSDLQVSVHTRDI